MCGLRLHMKLLSPSTISPPKLAFTRVEAAQALGISPITIDRLAKRGLLNPSRATRRPLYSVVEIERFLSATKGGLDE